MAIPGRDRGWLLAPTVAASAAVVLLAAAKLRSGRVREERLRRVAGGRVVPLLAEEISIMDMGPHGHVTVFEGSECPEPYLRSRVAEIAAANPWLLGRLVSDPGTGAPALWVPDPGDEGGDFAGADSLLRVESVDTRGEVLSCANRNPDHFATTGVAALDRADVPLFKVTLFRCDAAGSFSILCSMNHVLGDGSTLYGVWNMLHLEAVVKSVRVDRVADWKGGASLTSLGDFARKKFWWFLLRSDAGPLHRLLRGTRCTDAPRMHFAVRHVRPEWIEKQKAAYRTMEGGDGDVAYLSSNDILVSWFFCTTKPAAGGVAVNMRGRNPRLSSDNGGNYAEFLVLYPDEYASPVGVRRAISSLGAGFEGDDALKPGPGRRIGSSSAWHGDYARDLELPGPCRQTLHSIAVGQSGLRYFARWVPYIVVFRTGEGRLGVLCNTAEPLGDMAPFGDEIEGWDGLSFDTASLE